MLPIVGIIKTSLIDYPKRLASVFFTSGCNFHCSYCHNPQLVTNAIKSNISATDLIWEHLRQRKKLLDGIVITGGEPTIHGEDLVEFVQTVKKLDYLVKLDTNGSHPDLLKRLVANDLLDYVAMDIKTSLDEYDSFTSKEVNVSKISESIRFLNSSSSKLELEFRTTLHPLLHNRQIFQEMLEMVAGAPFYVLQNFSNRVTLDSAYTATYPFTDKELKEMQSLASQYVDHCLIR